MVSIITVNFNQHYVTEELLNSIIHINTFHEIEVIVVDNGSVTNPVPNWKEIYPQFLFIRSEQNLGFAGGNNLGIKSAKGEFLFLVNNDTVFTPDLLEKLVSTLQHNPQVGIVSPKLLYYDQPTMIQYAGYTPMNYLTARNACIGQFEQDQGQYDFKESKTGYAHGAAMLVNRSVIAKVGLMFEGYFLYYEELDWCDRIKRAGYEIWVNTNASIFHKESISVGKNTALKAYFMNRNRILFMRRNAPWYSLLFFWLYFIIFVAFRNCLKYIKEGHSLFIKQLIRAIWWNLTQPINSLHLGFKG